MSVVGYNGAELIILLDGTKIAAVRTKTATQDRTPVDVTTDDNDGWMRHLPRPGTRGFNVDVGGVVTAGNETTFNDIGEDDFLPVTIQYPNGDVISAEDGFFLGTISQTTSYDGSVEFTATLMSSGIVTRTPPVQGL